MPDNLARTHFLPARIIWLVQFAVFIFPWLRFGRGIVRRVEIDPDTRHLGQCIIDATAGIYEIEGYRTVIEARALLTVCIVVGRTIVECRALPISSSVTAGMASDAT
jgi:hypothetical protein